MGFELRSASPPPFRTLSATGAPFPLLSKIGEEGDRGGGEAHHLNNLTLQQINPRESAKSASSAFYHQPMTKLTVQFIDQIHDIPQLEWNRLAGTDYPFMRYEFLAALEISGAVSPESGWIPKHLVAFDATGKLAAIAPCYLKDHSYGEYVFDWSWANAYHENGLEYYPKLLTAIPFTPCAGPRLVIAPEQDSTSATEQCIDAIVAFGHQNRVSSWHLLFPQAELMDQLDQEMEGITLLKRIGSQYHWYNNGYETFADYLGAMTSRKRKTIRREREKVEAQGITFLRLTGEEVSAEQLKDFYVFYHATYMKRGRYGYLNHDFFELLVDTMPENLLFVFAQIDGSSVACALFLMGGDTIYGRYWGCLELYDQLHFETCYYQGIDYCIDQKLAHFDAGAQGEHKIQRGFKPIATYSYHWIAHPGFRDAIEDFLKHENAYLHEYIAEAQDSLPFKQIEGG